MYPGRNVCALFLFNSAFSYHLFPTSQLFFRDRHFLSWGKHRTDEDFDEVEEEEASYEKEECLEHPPSHGLLFYGVFLVSATCFTCCKYCISLSWARKFHEALDTGVAVWYNRS